MNAPQPLASPQAVADWLGITPYAVGRLRRAGALKAVQLSPRVYRYAWPDVKAYAAARRR